MVKGHVDINETEIFQRYPEVLITLFKDHATDRNIFWATDSYAHLRDGYQYRDPKKQRRANGAYQGDG